MADIGVHPKRTKQTGDRIMLRREAKRITPVTLESLLAGYTEPDRTRVLLSYLRTVDDSYRDLERSQLLR